MPPALGDVLPVAGDAARITPLRLGAATRIERQHDRVGLRRRQGDCLAATKILGRHDPGGREVRVTLTARQWDVVVAELDRDALTLLHNGKEREADECMRVRDAVLAQVGRNLPAHPGPTAVARQHLEPGDAGYYTLFQPPRRGWRTGFTYGRPDTTTGPPIRSAVPGRGLAVATGTPTVDVTVQTVPAAPDLDVTQWDYVGEISQQWVGHPYPELILAVPDQEGTELWPLSTHVWPHVVYRVRLCVRGNGSPQEEHMVQVWPWRTATPVEHRRPTPPRQK
ncbi:hypothetical protein BZB76_2493 [Actinomadura pelletieri DSM 43383]|uniref:Uncharacterized protein n=1 Tax=Actinomadura pelletieri DSM 43383 TaxID=1120940 RepID=A0A495QUF1_9ACTN|nr:hypothetical protein [Actinomadura pelletieri]RKS77119.1 hypothetical protein BZB76_2493 [Actinomadura pelletieri DSM 43383]